MAEDECEDSACSLRKITVIPVRDIFFKDFKIYLNII